MRALARAISRPRPLPMVTPTTLGRPTTRSRALVYHRTQATPNLVPTQIGMPGDEATTSTLTGLGPS